MHHSDVQANHPKEIASKLDINRAQLEELLRRRFFFVPAFSIYGGVKGLYDYGPPGCAIKANLLAYWRQHFVLEDNMLEIDCTCLTPEAVLETSGHVAKFQDYMVRDVKTNECFRADHLLKDRLEKLLETEKDPKKKEEYAACKAQIDDLSQEELGKKLTLYECKAPDTGNDISAVFPFNLMFPTQIGPTGLLKGYLRPETAQGIFVNFAKLLDFNGGKLPFAAAQIGLAFRNEISPRSGLLRVREFQMAEIEHFVRGDRKDHPKFASVSHLELQLFPRDAQLHTRQLVHMTIGQAVEKKIVNNQTLGYYLARTALFLWAIGVHKDKVRFRQHLGNEMAHYASDCWDAEILTSYGWVECVGHADRSAFDLTQHANKTKARLTANEKLAEPKIAKVLTPKPNKGVLGPKYGKAGPAIADALGKLEEAEVEALKHELETHKKASITVDGKAYELTPEMVGFAVVDTKVSVEQFTPHVIEPSFGIGRIIYSLLEHAYAVRDGDANRQFLTLSPLIAPIKCSILPLGGDAKLVPFITEIAHLLTRGGISNKVDDSGASIGRRYARTDEIGIPFGITIDFETVTNRDVTLREIRTASQVRIKIEELVATMNDLIQLKLTWAEVQKKHPNVVAKPE